MQYPPPNDNQPSNDQQPIFQSSDPPQKQRPKPSRRDSLLGCGIILFLLFSCIACIIYAPQISASFDASNKAEQATQDAQDAHNAQSTRTALALTPTLTAQQHIEQQTQLDAQNSTS